MAAIRQILQFVANERQSGALRDFDGKGCKLGRIAKKSHIRGREAGIGSIREFDLEAIISGYGRFYMQKHVFEASAHESNGWILGHRVLGLGSGANICDASQIDQIHLTTVVHQF